MEADTLSRIITESGPLAGMIVLLGVLIKYWFTESRSQLERLVGKVDGILAKIAENNNRIVKLETRVDGIEQRVNKLEGNSQPINIRHQ